VRAILTSAGLLLALPERLTTIIGLATAVVAYGLAALAVRAGSPALVRAVPDRQPVVHQSGSSPP
jgi:hypothetical protein